MYNNKTNYVTNKTYTAIKLNYDTKTKHKTAKTYNKTIFRYIQF